MAKNTRGAAKDKPKKAEPVAEVETFEDELEDLEDADTDTDEDEDDDLEDDDEDSDDEDDDDSDLEELEDDEPAPTAAKGKKATKSAKATAPKREPIEFGSAWLAELIKEKTGKSVDARGLRVLLRKLAKENAGVTREVGTDKARYQWTGPKDPQVVAVLKAVQGGALEKAKSDGLAAARAAKEAKAAAKKAATETETPKAEKVKGKKTAPAEPAKAAKPAKKAKAKA